MTEAAVPDWNRVVQQHAHRVFRVALRILRSVPDAEDVSQDVFTEAFQLHARGPIRCWTGLLVRLATLRSIDRLRRREPTVELREDDRLSTVEPADQASARELADWLGQAIARLPDGQGAVFAMHYFEQLSRSEISAALEISLEAVSTMLYKARQRLLAQVSVFNGTELR